jgi:glycosyltransferase involved in cell wall biosynthesis
MRIGIDASSLLTSHTGVHVYIREVIRAMGAGAGENELRVFQPGLYPWRAPHVLAKAYNNLRLLYWIQNQLRRWADRENCRALISPDFLSPRHCRQAKIVVAYDAGFVKRPGDFNFLWRKLWDWVYFPALRQADAVVTITEAAKAEICLAFGLEPSRVTVIPPACDTARFSPVSAEECAAVVKKYGLAPQRYLLHVGVQEKRKNLPRLIRAFARLAPDYPDVKLVLIGPIGPKANLDDSAEIRGEIRRLSLAERVMLPGYVPAPDLPRLYQGALALVFPSLHEGFGIPVLEAFASGTAVGCSDTDVLREVAGDAARFFEPEQEEDLSRVLGEFLADPEMRKELAERGRIRVQDFSWKKSAEAFLCLAETLAGKANK